MSDDEIEAVAWRNALQFYSWDPFAHRPQEKCTVGALRAESPGHDVSERSFDHGRFERSGKGTDLSELAQHATA